MSKKCKKVLIFTPIFTLKTNMSYKITSLSIANRPIFKISVKNPYFFQFSDKFNLVFAGFSAPLFVPLRIGIFLRRVG